jgi:ATP-binding cassette subfamily B protein
MVWRSSPKLTFALGALTLTGAIIPPVIAWAGKRIVDAVVAHDKDMALQWVVIELVLVALQATNMRGLSLTVSTLGSRLGTDINVEILERATKLSLSHFEDSEFYDKMSKARREASSRPLSLVRESFSLVQSVLTLIGYGALLVRFSGLIVVVLMVATIPATIAEMRFSKTAFRMRNWRSPDSRRLIYYEYVLANDEHAKEVKLFGLGSLFLGRYKELAEKFHTEDTKLAVRRTIYGHLLSLVATLSFYGAYAFMAVLTALSKLTLGSMTMYVLAFRSGQQAFQSILSGIGSMYEHNLYMSNLFAFLDQSTERTPTSTSTPTPTPTPTLDHGIVLDHVSFKYPGSDKFVLEDLSLTIPEGQSVALVGQNGAGKTTLVKLLTRLYEPTSGRILLDGRDLRDWDEVKLRARFGVVFQDFNQYQLRVSENVGVGSVSNMQDTPRLERAVTRGGAEPVVAGLSAGMDTALGRWFQDGVELSGGQWQKIALSRGFMREEADILVLDEPTAALDAEAEHAVFERFRELSQGKTTFIISHRFPTVRMADRILVLEHGHVIEDGTHEGLVAAQKTYARLYEMQARGYL